MKNYLLIILFLTLFLACKEEQKERKNNQYNDVEQQYTKNHIRRFTFFIESYEADIVKVINATDWKKISKNNRNILKVNAYQKDKSFFLIFDTSPFYNATQLRDELNKDQNFVDLKTSLELADFDFEKFLQPLERIFKLEQKREYSPEEGQLKTVIKNHKRFVWTLLLQEDPEMIVAYKKAHSMNEFWPQITNNMKSIGVKDMELYLYNTRAILIMDTPADFNLEIMAPRWQKLPREMEWQKFVSKFQRTEPDSRIQEKWLDMKELNY